MIKFFTQLPLHWQILIALVFAVLAGSITGTDAGFLGITYFQVYEFLGALFLNALKMLIVPLVMSSIIVGAVVIARLEGEDGVLRG